MTTANYRIERDVVRGLNTNTGSGNTLATIDSTGTLFVKNLIGGTDISLVDTGSSIIINSTAAGGGGISGSAVTTGTSSSIIATIPITLDTVKGLKLNLTTGNQTDNLGSFHLIETVFKNNGGVVSIVDGPPNCTDFIEAGYAITASNIALNVVGTNVEVVVTGVFGKTIEWNLIGEENVTAL